jgi:hypothetical protein
MGRRLTRSQQARRDREEEILAKSADELTPAEWKWLGAVMGRIIKEDSRGRKKKTQHDDWMHARNRAQFLGQKPPTPAELAGLKRPVKRDFSNDFAFEQAKDSYDVAVSRASDAFKKAKLQRSLPPPPRRTSPQSSK